MLKSLDQKLAAIHADPHGSKEFILADAKDADMAFGVAAPGTKISSEGQTQYRTLAEYREQIRQIIRQGLVDIVLMSASTSAELTLTERLFDESPITPAARGNDTSDVWALRGNQYLQEPSLPFSSAPIDHLQCGHVDCTLEERAAGVDLALYSITFNNRLEIDHLALTVYQQFRLEAERKGLRHFLELFNPNVDAQLTQEQIPQFMNDCVARVLAGVPPKSRPIFLKIVYNGPKALEELVTYDPHLVVGILGGSAGTTYDAFKMLEEAKKYGARVALYGRKINSAEHQLAFIHFLYLIAEGTISAEDAVKAYHAVLKELNISPHRKLEDDLQLRTNVMSYASSTTNIPASPLLSKPEPTDTQAADTTASGCACGGATHSKCDCDANAKPDFSKMTSQEKLAYHQAQRDRVFGRFDRPASER